MIHTIHRDNLKQGPVQYTLQGVLFHVLAVRVVLTQVNVYHVEYMS